MLRSILPRRQIEGPGRLIWKQEKRISPEPGEEVNREVRRDQGCHTLLLVSWDGDEETPKNLATRKTLIRAGSSCGGISGQKAVKSVFKEAMEERDRTQCVQTTSP